MKLGGKDRVLAFTVNALLELRDGHKVDLLKGENQGEMSLEKIRAIAFITLKHGAKKEGVEFTTTIEEVGDWLDIKAIGELMKEIQSQTIGDRPQGEPGSGELPGQS